MLCGQYQNHPNVDFAKVKIKKTKSLIKKCLIDKCSKVWAFQVINSNNETLML